MFTPKGMGGLGFKDLRLFNIALLGRQLWRLVHNKNTLCYQVLSSKYFPEEDPFDPKKVDKPSYVWSSFCSAASALKNGFGWQVGNGRSISICNKRWGFEELDGSFILLSAQVDDPCVVRDLWLQSSYQWDKAKVGEIYGDEMGRLISELPLHQHCPPDRIIWFHDPRGIYTTKSGYSWLVLKKVGCGPHRIFWRLIWKLNIPPKLKVFVWRIWHNHLPTGAKIASINPSHNNLCPRCNNNVETLIHALRVCDHALAILRLGGIDGRILQSNWEFGIDWLESSMRLIDKQAFECLVTVL